MSYEKETGLKPNGNLIFYGWAGILVAIAVFFSCKFGPQYDENGKEIK